MEIKSGVPQAISEINEQQSAKVLQLKSKCLYMYDTGKPFTLTKSGSAYKLESKFFNSRAVKKYFSSADRNFIRSVKDYILKNNIPDRFVFTDYRDKKINYIDVKDFKSGNVINNSTEIDMTKAYWVTAYQMGVISKKIYEIGLTVDKIVRLAALGGLAKRIEQWVFDGQTMKKLPDIRSYETENIWFAICKRVADIMGQAAKIAGKDFIFYWVDGIYVNNNSDVVEKIQKYFTECGYESKINSINQITFNDYSFKVDGDGKDPDDIKEFTYPRSNRIKTVRQYNEDLRLRKLAEEVYLNIKAA